MLKFLTEPFSFYKQNQKNSNRKILITLLVLFIFRFGNTIPLDGIDQVALKKGFLEQNSQNSLMQVINMYAGGGDTVLSPFSLGIIPYINASILIDILTTIIPKLERLQQEEGDSGRQTLTFYKKILTFLFAIIQSGFLIFYLKPYFYISSFTYFFNTAICLTSGALMIVWLTSLIDNKGIGNGTSLIIFTNIIITILGKNIFNLVANTENPTLEIVFLIFLILLICICQMARMSVPLVSARQLAFLENKKKENEKLDVNLLKDFEIGENGLSIRLNQAGIFPIIIASNLISFIVSFNQFLFGIGRTNLLNTIIYYILVIGFNYFYTIIFWDPQKISEQLRKASVSIIDVTPGQETINYLEKVVKVSSVSGGIALCFILIFYDSIKSILPSSLLLNQINISSLIILVGIAYDIQRVIRSFPEQNISETAI